MTDRRLRIVSGSQEAAGGIVGLLDQTTIQVRLPHDPPWRRQVLASALVDLLCRLFPRIEIHGPGALVDHLEAVRRHGVAPAAPEPGRRVEVVVGESPAGADVFCDGDGWQSYLGPEPSRVAGLGDEAVPIGPLAAACRAAARVFAIALADLRGAPLALEPTYWSALTLGWSPEPLEPVDLPPPGRLRALLCGAGSIGGAAAYAFARVSELAGELDVVDPQVYEPHNPDRAILATEELAAAGAEKASAVAAVLEHHSKLDVTPYRGSLESWVVSRPAVPLPRALCAFDSVASRRELQDALPLEVINAACGAADVAVSGHRTAEGPCVYCLHLPQVLDTERITFKLIVATTKLPPGLVKAWMEQHIRLEAPALGQIERNRGMEPGALAAYAGRTLVELHREALAYGEEQIEREHSTAAIAAPWVTALAGFMLAAEALKADAHADYAGCRLGPWAPGRTLYTEDLYTSARHALVSAVPRWEGPECLCRSARRLRLLAERYG